MNNATTHRENTSINKPSQQRNESETEQETASESEDSETSTTTTATWRSNYKLRTSRIWRLSVKSAFGDNADERIRDTGDIPDNTRYAIRRDSVCSTGQPTAIGGDQVSQDSRPLRFVQDYQLHSGNNQQFPDLNSRILHSSNRSRRQSRLPGHGSQRTGPSTITGARRQNQLTVHEIQHQISSQPKERVVVLRRGQRRNIQNNCRQYLCLPQRTVSWNNGVDLSHAKSVVQYSIPRTKFGRTGPARNDTLHYHQAGILTQRPQLPSSATGDNSSGVRQQALHHCRINTGRGKPTNRHRANSSSGLQVHESTIQRRTLRPSLVIQGRGGRTTHKKHANDSPSNNFTRSTTIGLGNVRNLHDGIDQYYSRVAILTAGTGVYVTQDGRTYRAVEYDDKQGTATIRAHLPDTKFDPLTVQTDGNELKVSVNNGSVSVSGHVGVSNHLGLPLEVIGI